MHNTADFYINSNSRNRSTQKTFYALSVIVTIVIICSPILSVYGISKTYNTFTFRDLFLVGLLPILTIFSFWKRIFLTREFIIYFFYFLILTLLSIMITQDTSYVLRSARYIISLIYLVFFCEFFNYSIAKKVYVAVSLVAAVFLLIQYLGISIFGFYIPGHLTFLPIARENLYGFHEYVNTMVRPRSLFLEPAYFGVYVAFGVYFGFNRYKLKNIKTFIIMALFTFSIFLSASTTGIFLVLFIWLLNLAVMIRKNHNSKFLLIVFILIIIVYAFSYSQQFDLVKYRLESGDSAAGRFSGYLELIEIFKNEKSVFPLLFGRGLVGFPGFIAGYGDILYNLGIIGTFLILQSIYALYKKCSQEGRQIIILFLIMNIGTSAFIYHGQDILLYLSFAVKNSRGES